jgi:hypothetical protein
MLHEGRLKDDDIVGWIRMAKEVARQHIHNEAFNQAIRKEKPTVKPSVIVPTRPTTLFRTFPPVVKPYSPMPTGRSIFPLRTSPALPLLPPLPKLKETGPIPMEVDASRNKGHISMVCHWCGQPGLFKAQCPRRFNVRFMSTDELEEHLQTQLVHKDIAGMTTDQTEESAVENIEEAEIEEEGFRLSHE